MDDFTVKLTPEQAAACNTLRLPIKGPIDVCVSDGGVMIRCLLGDDTKVEIIPHGDCLHELATALADGLQEYAHKMAE